MKNLIYILLILPAFAISQVGLGTDNPSATLDIVSKSNSSTNNALSIKDKDENTLLNVSDNGNVNFNGALLFNNNSGLIDRVLVSDGNNNSPKWVTENSSTLKQFVLVCYNAFNNTASAYTAANVYLKTNPNTANLSSLEVGTWDTSLAEYTVVRAGVYEVTVDAKISTQVDNANRNGFSFLFLGGFILGSQGKNQTGSARNIHLTSKASRYLNVGEKIYFNVSASSTWRIDQANININFSEKTL